MSAATDRPLPGRTLAALEVPAFRSFFLGQAVSLPGTWMQTVAQGWLVVQLTGSAALLGTVVALQYLPVLLLAPWGGLLADRLPRRRLLLASQAAMAASALALGLLAVTGRATVATVVATALVFGVATAVDNPTRQSFVLEMVGPELVRNAVSLNSALLNASRTVGPAIAGLVIVAVGPGPCFLLNAASFTGTLVALARMRLPVRPRPVPTGGPLRQLREGFAHVAQRPELLRTCLTVFLVASLAWEFPITLPVLARDTFASDARLYGWLTSSMGIGAVLGALVVARRGRTGLGPISVAATAFGTAVLALSMAPYPWAAVLALVAVGATGSAFLSTCNATVQLASDDEFRGRVMSIWSLCFIWSTPVGGPIVGLIGEHLSPRWALATGALACFAAAAALRVRRGGVESSAVRLGRQVTDSGPG